MGGNLSCGGTEEFITFLIAVIALYDPVRKMPTYYTPFSRRSARVGRSSNFIDPQDEVLKRKKAVALKGFKGLIEFRDVRFGYEPDGECKEILHGISLTVRRGKIVGWSAPVARVSRRWWNLLPRFFDVTGGAIYLDDHDVRDLTLVSLRKQIGKITQETVLFNDTVRNNIAYGQPDVPWRASSRPRRPP